MDDETLTFAAQLFLAFSHPARLRIVEALAERPRTAAEIGETVGLTAPRIAQHLALLGRAGMVRGVPRGTPQQYSLCDARLGDLIGIAQELGPHPTKDGDKRGDKDDDNLKAVRPDGDLEGLLTSLLDRVPTALPFLSAYVDLTPQPEHPPHSEGGIFDLPAPLRYRRPDGAAGRPCRPGVEQTHTMLASRCFPLHGAAHDSFEADAMRLRHFLDAECFGESRDLAVFACAGEGFWAAVCLQTPVETRLVIDDTPFLAPLLGLCAREDAEAPHDLRGALESGRYAIMGVDPVLAALRDGGVETLFLDASLRSDGLGSGLVFEANRVGAPIKFVENDPELCRAGGVAALRRSSPASDRGGTKARLPKASEK